jgi:hypothetical protein
MRSTSQQVKAANSKLAQFLRSQEEEEAFLNPKRRRRPSADEPRRHTSRNRWIAEPDFTYPSGLVDRPRTARGGTTFHFKIEPISKTFIPRHADGRIIEWAADDQHTSPLEHARYIERDGSLESDPREHAVYIERPGSTEIETVMMSGDGHAEINEVVAFYSNISDDPEIRDLFWKLVPEEESEPRNCNLELNVWRSPDWWVLLPEMEGIDREFREHACREAAKVLRTAGLPKEHKPKSYRCPVKRGQDILRQLTEIGGFDQAEPPVTFAVRGGRMQYRIVIELPHELPPTSRLTVLTETCDYLGSLEVRTDEFGDNREVGMMFTGVVHAPDRHNDNRNFHVHIVAHERPAILVHDEQGIRWEFSKKKLDATRDIHFPKKVRVKVSEIVNARLEAERIERRYDPRKYVEMGIVRTPTTHLGKDAHALDSVGIFHPKGARNGISIWNDARLALEADLARIKAGYGARSEAFKYHLIRADGYETHRSDTKAGWQAAVARSLLVDRMIEERRDVLLLQLNEAKAKSKAERTIRTCDALLDEIAAGEAEQTTVRNEANIRARRGAAEAWIDGVDQALAADRNIIQQAFEKLDLNDERLAEVDAELVQFTKAIATAASLGGPPVDMPASLREKVGETPFAVGQPGSSQTTAAPRKMDGEPLYSGPPTMEGRAISQASVSPEPTSELESQPEGSMPTGNLCDTAQGNPISSDEAVRERAIRDAATSTEWEIGPTCAHPQTAAEKEPVKDTSGEAKSVSEASDRELSDESRRAPDRNHDVDPTSRPSSISERQAGGPLPLPSGPTIFGDADKDSTAPPAAERLSDRNLDSSERQAELTTGSEPIRSSEIPPADHVSFPADGPNPASKHSAVESAEAVPGRPLSQAQTNATNARPQRPSDRNREAVRRREGQAAEAALKAWNAAFDYIEKERLEIITRDGGYDVMGLPNEFRPAMLHPSLKERTRGRIASRYNAQEKEMDRILQWIHKHGGDEQQLTIVNGIPIPTGNAPTALRNLFRKHDKQRRLLDFAEQESGRREREAEAERERDAAVQREREAAIQKAGLERLKNGLGR